MVAAVRRRASLRSVAKRFGTTLRTVQYWVERAGTERLDRVDWNSRPSGLRTAANRTPEVTELRVLSTRKFLREKSDLGESGPQAIRDEMLRRRWKSVPSARTIARILGRRGVLDGKRRQRRTPPPRGWFLSEVATSRAELDSFDIIEDLVIEGGADLNILTGISTHGGLCAVWPRRQITAKITVESLLTHWREFGLPGFAKFDNDTVFQGAHQHPDSFGRVTRLCLSLGVTPIFAPPRETGFQAEVEAFNGRWQKGVWQRFHFTHLQGVQSQSRKYVAANHQKNSLRIADAPRRPAIPHDWKLDLQRPLRGKVIFLRRTDAKGRVSLLGHTYLADENWSSRLVRAEVNLTQGKIHLFALRRREPSVHRFLRSHDYKTPQRKFIE